MASITNSPLKSTLSPATRAAAAQPDLAHTPLRQITALTAAQVKAFNETTIRAMSAEQVGALSVTGVSGLTATQVAQFSTTQVAALKSTQLAGLTPLGAAGISSDDVHALTSTQVAGLSANGVKGLTATAVNALSNTQVGAITAAAVKGFTTTQFAAMSASQFGAIGLNQLRSLAAAQINSLDDAKIGALPIANLGATQIAGLDARAAARLSTSQLTTLATTQIASLSVAAAGALTSAQQASLSAAQANALKATTVGDAGGLRIDLIWGGSTARAPDGFRAAVIAAARSFTDNYANNAVINIQVGYGETNGRAVSSSAVAQSMSKGSFTTYAVVRSALAADADQSEFQASADSTLPQLDPTSGGKFLMNTAQQKALGLAPANGTAIDGYIGLSKSLPMDFTHSGAPDKYDAVGALQHEISEIMGRTGSVGRAFGTRVYTSLDLFRYKTTGSGPARALAAGGAADYFSIDGGATHLGVFNATTGTDDYADWGVQEPGDAYGFGSLGVKSATPARDVIVMAAIGYNPTAQGLAAARGAGIVV